MYLETKSELFDKYEELASKGAIRTCRTSGSSGRALYIPMNQVDLDMITRVGARCFKHAGVTKNDRVINCLNSSLWFGGCVDTDSFERTGANTFNYSVGNTKGLIEVIRTMHITVLSCTPSYIDRIKEVCFQEFSIDPSQLGIRLIVAGGEAGADNPNFRARVEREWDCQLINGNYGQADAVSVIASESPLSKGSLTFLGYPEATAQILVGDKLVDPAPGVEGELIITTHWKKGLVKRTNYRSGDLVRVNFTDIDHTFNFNIIGRADDMIVLRGLNVYPSTINNVFQRLLAQYQYVGKFQIHISEVDPIDQCKIYIDVQSRSITNVDAFMKDLHTQLKNETSISFDICYHEIVVGNTGKVKLVVRDL